MCRLQFVCSVLSDVFCLQRTHPITPFWDLLSVLIEVSHLTPIVGVTALPLSTERLITCGKSVVISLALLFATLFSVFFDQLHVYIF